MNFLRSLLRLLLLLAALAFVAGLVVFTPAFQTWYAENQLHRVAGLSSDLESFWMGFGKAELEQGKFSGDGWTLAVPSVQAQLSTWRAWSRGEFAIRSVVAKGWTLDLSGSGNSGANGSEATAATASPSSASETDAKRGVDVSKAQSAQPQNAPWMAQAAVRAIRVLLSRWRLPMRLVSADGIELEGDVLVKSPTGGDPVPVHVKFHGKDLAIGKTPNLTAEAEAALLDAQAVPIFVSGKARIESAVTDPQSVSFTGIRADIAARGGSVAADATELSVNVARETGSGQAERYRFELVRNGGPVASWSFGYDEAKDRLAGNWKLALKAKDSSLLGPWLPLSGGDVTGEGTAESDQTLQRLHVTGRLSAAGPALVVAGAELRSTGVNRLDAEFDAHRSEEALQVDRLEFTAGAEKPIATLRMLQPVVYNLQTHGLNPAQADGELAELAINDLQFERLPATWADFSLVGGKLSGAWRIAGKHGEFVASPTRDVSLSGVSLTQGKTMLLDQLDLTGNVSAAYRQGVWHADAKTLQLRRRSKTLVTGDISLAPSGPGPAPGAALTGKWTADLRAVDGEVKSAFLKAIEAESASGDLHAVLGVPGSVKSTFSLKSNIAGRQLAGQLDVQRDANGVTTFHVPLTMKWPQLTSDVALDGTWASSNTAYPVSLRLSAKHSELDQLRWLGGPVTALFLDASEPAQEDVIIPAPGATPGPRDAAPFWGVRSGQLLVSLDEFRAGGDLYKEVRGSIDVSPKALELKYGGYMAPDGNLTPLEGSLTFDASASDPYLFKVNLQPVTVDAPPLFGVVPEGQDPVFHGRFTVTSTLRGAGKSLSDLKARTERELHATSKNGIVRIFKTHVSLAGPEASKPIADAAGTVGSAIGSFFGAKGFKDSGAVKVNPTTQAVFDFSYGVAEIGYKELTFTATQAADGEVRVANLVMEADNERITGSGRVTPVAGKKLGGWTLDVELRFGARGTIADLMGKADLPRSAKDADGLSWIEKPIHLAGSLDHLDMTDWHDFLVAAARKPEAAKTAPGSGKK